MNTRFLTLVFGLALLFGGAALLWPALRSAEGHSEPDAPMAATLALGVSAKPAREVRSIEILPESAYGSLMEEAGVPGKAAAQIFEAAHPVYDLSAIRVGRTLDLTYEADGSLAELAYQPDSERILHVRRAPEGWSAELAPIEYEIRLRTVEGEIDSSLYAAGLAQGLDDRSLVALAEVFEWTIDFSQDLRKGDRFKFIYEERWLNGAYVMPGRVFAAKLDNDGKELLAFHFENAAGEEGYYDEKGQSLRKMFLKAPVAFKYITSGFTTGLRYVSAFNTSTGHRAIDYAAQAGTPIRATADGVVVSAGWNGPYGNFVSIRHNGTYTTNYAHQSKIAVKKGQRVSQGQTIGYVGSTGFSTGPHLHYEMVKNGVKINPLREDFPGTDPVKEEERPAFEETVARWKGQL